MQMASAKRRKLCKRDSEAAVQRITQTHFSQWPSTATDVKTARGLTLRETLLQERRAKAPLGGRVSTPLIDQCKTEFAPDDDLFSTMRPPEEEVRDELFEAVLAATSLNPLLKGRGPLMAFLRALPDVNEAELVGIIKSVAKVNPSTSDEARVHFQEVLNFLCSKGYAVTHGKYVGACTAKWDETLCAMWAHHDRQKLGRTSFLQSSVHCFIVFGTQVAADMQELMEKDGQWALLEQELTRTLAATSIGLQLYEVPLSMMRCDKWTDGVRQLLGQVRWQMPTADLLKTLRVLGKKRKPRKRF